MDDRILRMAIDIEKAGVEFYASFCNGGDAVMNALFRRLRDEERAHMGMFEGMLSRRAASGDAAPDAGRFVMSAGRAIFNREKLINETASLNSEAEILSFAMRRELDTVLLYGEMARGLEGRDKEIFIELAEVERTHFFTLAEKAGI